MSKMIGIKSGADWSQAPEGATHRALDSSDAGSKWLKKDSCCSYSYFCNGWVHYAMEEVAQRHFSQSVIKEEDLEMTKEVKQVRGVDDLEVGMFIRWNSHPDHSYVVSKPKQIISFNTGEVFDYGKGGCRAGGSFYTSSWSYTYSGEYTPIMKETEAERKIKELEETIALAQKQLQEYKEMK